MGQKVHPLGFRVGIIKKHQSQWFARFNKYKYSQSILEDRMIRERLSKLFPELLNPILTKANSGKKRDEEISITPRITQIKIERGLIPYEIGIQIHAENCDLLKSAIDNLKVKRELIVKLQKTRRYLLNLKLKLKDLTKNSSDKLSELNINQETTIQKSFDPAFFAAKNQSSSIIKSKRTRVIPSMGRTGLNRFSSISAGNKNEKKNNTRTIKGPFKFRSRLTKQELRRQRLIKKRLKKRQSIRSRYRQFILKGLFLDRMSLKNGNKIIQTLSLSSKKMNYRKSPNGQGKFITKIRTSRNGEKMYSSSSKMSMFSESKKISSGLTKTLPVLGTFKNTFSSRIKKKFVTLFIQKMNKKFLSHLKVLLMNYNPNIGSSWSPPNMQGVESPTVNNYLPLGYSKQWSLNRLNILKNQPVYKLNRMIVVLEQKLLVKLESLRKEFIAFGSISAQSSESLGYFQILNFLKNLKELVNKLKREQKLQLSITKNSMLFGSANSSNKGPWLRQGEMAPNTLIGRSTSKFNLSDGQSSVFKGMPNMQAQPHFDKISEAVFYKKLNNIEDECRKVKLIEYLKDLIKKHRTENIYFYLATISDARKDLRKIKQFTKRHADFLFGLNLNNFTSLASDTSASLNVEVANNKTDILQQKINERVSKVLEKASKKTNFEKTLQDVFLEQIEKQRTMCLENLQLTPKISIKFYAVNKKTLEQKASIVSESVVDALEKRKAFRKVIKDAKESLMRTPGVKGVKIQVAGRLNGAEIARTEWVRAGRVPLQTLRANLDYSYRTANTIYGIIGVRVWIFKGYAKLISK